MTCDSCSDPLEPDDFLEFEDLGGTAFRFCRPCYEAYLDSWEESEDDVEELNFDD